MRQGWPFETTIRAPVGTDRQGPPLEPALAWGSLAPATTGTSCSSYRAASTREREYRPAVLLCLLTIPPAQPPSNLFAAILTTIKHSPPKVLWIQLPNFCLCDQPTTSDRQQSSGVWVSPRTSVDLEVLCAFGYGICTATRNESQPNIACTQQCGIHCISMTCAASPHCNPVDPPPTPHR